MLRPAYLKKGDKIGIVATARKVSFDEVKSSIDILESWGLEVVIGKTIGLGLNQFAGTDAERKADIQHFFDDKEIKAVLTARGGYGTVRMMDGIKYDRFMQSPKWLIGFSDLTILHGHLNSVLGVQSIHGTMAFSFANNTQESLNSLKDALFGKGLQYEFPAHLMNKNGKMKGEIIGGNLSILYSMLGTNTPVLSSGKILFIEDLDEYLYHIDRMMMAMKRAGKLQDLVGLVVGGMSDMKDNKVPFGTSAEEIILEHVQEYDYPVCFNFPSGHISDNRAIVFGRAVNIIVGDECRFEG
ncbi:MAG: LD-carboxypeptidase [Chitinophagales bacterium]|nr:LD-carboxypeptidase [Chitinophagales bacterium]